MWRSAPSVQLLDVNQGRTNLSVQMFGIEIILSQNTSRKLENTSRIDRNSSLSWTCRDDITSHPERYAFVIHEQKRSTKYLTKKTDKGDRKYPHCYMKCHFIISMWKIALIPTEYFKKYPYTLFCDEINQRNSSETFGRTREETLLKCSDRKPGWSASNGLDSLTGTHKPDGNVLVTFRRWMMRWRINQSRTRTIFSTCFLKIPVNQILFAKLWSIQIYGNNSC